MTKPLLILLFITISALGLLAEEDPYLSGRAAMLKGSHEAALSAFEEALQAKPGETEVLYQKGLCHFELKQFPQARDAFYEVEKRRKGLGSYYLAKTEVRLNHPEMALKYLRIHLDSRYKRPEKEILLDPELGSLDDMPGWQSLWEEESWYSQEDQDFQEAQFLMEHEQELEAINLLNRLEKKGYQKSKVLTLKAEIYASLDNPKAARSALKAAVRSDVRNLDALESLAGYQLEEGENEEALSSLNRVIRQEPDRFEAYLQRAEARSRTDNLQGALKDVDLYLSYFPSAHRAYYIRGSIQHRHGKYLDAIQSYNKALAMDQGEASYYFARGLTYGATGTTRYAEKDMSMALDLDPYNGEIWFEKGKLSQQLGKMQDACDCFEKAAQYGIFEAGEFLEKHCR